MIRMKFGIRDIVWLTILVALAMTWWLDHQANVRKHDQLQQQVQPLRRELFGDRMERAQANVEIINERVRVLTTKVQAAQLEAASAEHVKLALPPP
jgi:outer membrane murein-binding lipoprotein Lpp